MLRATCFVRVILRLSLLGVLLLNGAIVLVHGQPANAPGVRVLLTSTVGCSAPCFLGISLGRTTLTAGLDRLHASPLIQSISPLSPEPGAPQSPVQYEIEFVQPLVSVRSATVKFLVDVSTGVIENILLMNTNIRLSDIALSFGQPMRLILDDHLHLGFVNYVAFYPEYRTYIQTTFDVCAPPQEAFWYEQQSIYIGIASEQNYVQQNSYYAADSPQTGAGWLQQLHNLRQADCV